MAKDKVTRCNSYMFRQVRCRGYMKKVNDGRFIVRHPDSGEIESCEYYYGWDPEKGDIVQEVEDYDGSLDFLKTYYEHRELEFTGVVVGMKMIVATGYLTVDTHTDLHGEEHIRIGKYPNDQVKCALVYYGCNKSRWVPLGELEIIEEGKE